MVDEFWKHVTRSASNVKPFKLHHFKNGIITKYQFATIIIKELSQDRVRCDVIIK